MPSICPQWRTDLADKFEISDAAKAWLHLEPEDGGLGLATLSDFHKATKKEVRWEHLISSAPLPDGIRQGARIKLAWGAVADAKKTEREKLEKGECKDHDELLSAPDMEDLQKKFYRQHLQTFPPHEKPSARTISRVANEMKARSLTVRDLAWVKTVDQMVKSKMEKGRGCKEPLPYPLGH